MEGLCIIVTPLIALMKDQVNHLQEKGIKATAIYSGMTTDEIVCAIDHCIYGNCKFLYLSPERLCTEIFLSKLPEMSLSLLVVDEAHCISQWGYDFRPSYLRIAEIREYFPAVPVLALTATATPEVVDDIQAKLHFKAPNVFKTSFKREELVYWAKESNDKNYDLLSLFSRMKEGGSTIVYVRNRKKTKEIAEILLHNGFKATYYHAGLDSLERDRRQREWQEGKVQIVVCTNAFGMGIDKPDVRLVIHLDIPDSLEAYFQEAGRAGRDRQKSTAVLLYGKRDKLYLKKGIEDRFPPREYVRNVYDRLAYYLQVAEGEGYGCVFDFNLECFVKTTISRYCLLSMH